jgi:hypothetical protein
MDGFDGRLKSAVQTSEAFYAAMTRHPKVGIERIPNGTNLTRVMFKGVNAADVSKRLADRGVAMPAIPTPQSVPTNTTITFGVNETWNRMTAADLMRAFEEALA